MDPKHFLDSVNIDVLKINKIVTKINKKRGIHKIKYRIPVLCTISTGEGCERFTGLSLSQSRDGELIRVGLAERAGLPNLAGLPKRVGLLNLVGLEYRSLSHSLSSAE